MKALRVGVFVAVVLTLLAAVPALLMQRSLARLDRETEAALEGPRARLAGQGPRPPLRGAVRTGVNGADEYRKLVTGFRGSALAAAVRAHGGWGSLEDVAKAAPAPLPDWLEAGVKAQAADVDALRAATLAERCIWSVDLEDQEADLDRPTASRLAHFALVAGHQRALAGDATGAADTYLDVARFGVDLGAGEPTLEYVLDGDRVLAAAVAALARLVEGRALAPADLARVDAELAALEALLPDLARAAESSRASFLVITRMAARGHDVFNGFGGGFAAFIPERWVVAACWPGSDRAMRELSAALADPDPAARDARLRAIDTGATRAMNPLVAFGVHPMKPLWTEHAAVRERIASVRRTAGGAGK